MIFAASIALVAKNAFQNKCQLTNVNYIMQTMPLDPDVSSMEIVVLSPQDLQGPIKQKMQEAINKKHPKVCVIYLYQNDKEKDFLTNVHKKCVKKVKVPDVKDAVSEFYGNDVVKVSKDSPTSVHDRVINIDTVEPVIPVREVTPVEKVESKPVLEPISVEVEEPSTVQPQQFEKKGPSIEERIAAISDFRDWELFKKSLEKDSVTRKLIEENTEYSGLVNMLDVWDVRIRDIFNDITLSANEKFDKIKEFGLQRSVLKASENSIYCSKLQSIMTAIVSSASKTVTAKVNEMKEAVYTLAIDKKAVIEGVELQPLLNRRLEVQLELMELLRSIIELYKVMDGTVSYQIENLDAGLPSSNEFISSMLGTAKTMFLPTNSPSLATSLMDSLQTHRMTMSSLENEVNNIIKLIFQIAEVDEDIINYQQTMIAMLKAQRVEDVVIVDSLIKNIVRIFIGLDDTGRTSTALAYAGMMSRRHNTLLLDFTKNSKLSSYGIEPMPLEEFKVERRQQQLLCVAGVLNQDDSEEVTLFVNELKTRIDYYPCIVVVLDTTQHKLLEMLSSDALTVSYLTDCSIRSIEAMKQVIQEHKYDNIARKIVVIDAPVDILEVTRLLNADFTKVKIVPIPYLREMRGCCLKKYQPFDNDTILTTFEEAFR
ncbi:MAG: hypothetical protein LBS29_04680 [Endomicrobium sp.]|jgi:hypothetical protein|nr:hypothetical protein [Endomicrobium sp.]